MLVQEIMTKEVVTIDSNDTIFDAFIKYRDEKVGCLIVTDKERCVGIVTERDLIEKAACLCKDPKKTKIKEIMSSDIKKGLSAQTLIIFFTLYFSADSNLHFCRRVANRYLHSLLTKNRVLGVQRSARYFYLMACEFDRPLQKMVFHTSFQKVVRFLRFYR